MSGVTFERQKMKDSSGASQAALMVKNPPANAKDIKRFDPWVGTIPWRRKWQSTPVFLAWKSPWTEELGRLQSTGSQRVEQEWETLHPFTQFLQGQRLVKTTDADKRRIQRAKPKLFLD